jgi:hypothetical protein
MASTLYEKYAKTWRETVVDSRGWTAVKGERPTGGEAKGFWVERDNLRGYLKPSRPDAIEPNWRRAANEKISADLAFDLGLPVPPAVLVDGLVCGGTVQAAVVSLVLHPVVTKWGTAMASENSKSLALAVQESTKKKWSGIFAFDAWIGNSDRHNSDNTLIGSDSAEDPNCQSELFFIDFANSMIQSGWDESATWGRIEMPAYDLNLMGGIDREGALEMAERIQSLSDRIIDQVVGRIPEMYLTAKQREIVSAALIVRRDLLPEAVASFLPK